MTIPGIAIAVAGLIIVMGYGIVAVSVAPNFHARRTLTRVGGTFFFMLCAGTHLELAGHYLSGRPITMGELESVHMALIHVPQALAVLMFISGLYVENRIPTRVNPRSRLEDAIYWFAGLRWLNRMSDAISKRLTLYAVSYALVVLASSLLGI